MTTTIQCEYGTARTGSVNQERCEKTATHDYLQVLEGEEPYHLCEEHFNRFHRGDYLSKR